MSNSQKKEEERIKRYKHALKLSKEIDTWDLHKLKMTFNQTRVKKIMDKIETAFKELVTDLLKEAKAVGGDEELKAYAEAIAADVASAIKLGWSDISGELKAQALLLLEIYRIKIVKAEQEALLKFLGKAVRLAAQML